VHVKVDLAYRVAYLVDGAGDVLAAQSGVTRSTVDDVLKTWGYARTRDGEWEVTDILNAIDAVQFPVERLNEAVSAN
jgi:hypothetical protein